MRRLLGYLAVSIVSALVGLLAVPVSTRLFEQNVLGQLNLLVSIALIIYVVLLFGMDQGYIRFFYEQANKGARKLLLVRSLVLPLLTSVLLIVALLLCRDWLGLYLNGEPLCVALSLGFLVLSLVLLRFAICFCRVSNQLLLFGAFTIVNVLFSKCIYLFNLGDKTFSVSLRVIIVVSIAATVACVLFLMLSNSGERTSARQCVSFKSLFSYSLPLMPAMLLSTVNANIPLFFVRSFLDFSAVGVFAMSVTVSSAVNVIGSGVNSFWPTYVFKNYSNKQHVIQLFHRALTFCLFLLATILIIARPVIPMFLGEGYESSANLFAILLISPLCYTIGETAGVGIHIQKKSSLFLLIYCGGLVINIALCFIMTSWFGITGAAASVSLTAIMMLLAKAIIGNLFYDSTGSFRWLLSAISLVSVQAISCQVLTVYPATVIISLASVVLFPFLAGISSFKRDVKDVADRLLILTKKGA